MHATFGHAFHKVPEHKRNAGSDFVRSFESAMKGFDGAENLGRHFEISLPSLWKELRLQEKHHEKYDESEGKVLVSM